MSLQGTARAFPTLLKVAVAEAVAYRAEMFVWVLATTMPLVMLALFSAVAADAPMGRFGQADFVAYFLATFIVRQLTGSWAAWEINFEVREGRLSTRLLRPIHPLVGYAVENIGAMPLRIVVSVPVAVIALATVGSRAVSHSFAAWALWLFAVLGAWLLTLLTNLLVGALALFMESSLKVMDIYLAFYFVASGYLIPVELFPESARAAMEWMPFRYQIGFPVEVMTGAFDGRLDQALLLLLRQWCMVLVLWVGAAMLWNRGMRRFAAYGG